MKLDRSGEKVNMQGIVIITVDEFKYPESTIKKTNETQKRVEQ